MKKLLGLFCSCVNQSKNNITTADPESSDSLWHIPDSIDHRQGNAFHLHFRGWQNEISQLEYWSGRNVSGLWCSLSVSVEGRQGCDHRYRYGGKGGNAGLGVLRAFHQKG